MADVFTKAKRSEMMSRIRGRGNKDTELALTKLFRQNKVTGWRRHVEIRGGTVAAVCDRRKLSGAPRAPLQKSFRVRPDFVFRQVRLAVFVRWLFLAWLPEARDEAEEQSCVLAA